MNSDVELARMIETELKKTVPGILEALKEFRRHPMAQTFKDAENIPDALVGEALDRIVGELLKEVAAENAPRSQAPQKKRSHGRRELKIQLKHGVEPHTYPVCSA